MKTLLKVVLALALVVVVFVVAASLYVASAPEMEAPKGSQSLATFERGPHEVVEKEVTLTDTSRPTPANDDYAGEPHRTLNARVWYPSTSPAEPGPLVVYSHGFMSTNEEGRYVNDFLASHGYVVIATDYPLSSMRGPGRPTLEDLPAQPGDVSFMYDTLIDWSADPNHWLAGRVNPDHIATLGLSLGGMTTTLVAFHPKLRDTRIDAAISIAGPSVMFTKKFFAKPTPDFLMIAGDVDAMVDYSEHAAPLRKKSPRSTLVTLKGGSHTGFSEQARLIFRDLDNPDSVGCNALSARLAEIVQEDGENPFPDLGGEEEGVVMPPDGIRPCQEPELPIAMRPQRQHALVTLAAYSFFESRFHPDKETRAQYRSFLTEALPTENEDVMVDAPS